jgi:hypothetical protein
MTVPLSRMGYETLLYYGTAGDTAATQITNAIDVDYNLDPERGETTVRGNGTSPPVVTSRVTALKPTVTFKMLNRPTDTALIALLAAAKTGAPVAIRTKHEPGEGGKGFDGDMTFSVKQSAPLKGEAAFEFTGEATEEAGRVPQLWV